MAVVPPFLLAGIDGLLNIVAHIPGGGPDAFQHFAANRRRQAVIAPVHVLRHFRGGTLHSKAAAYHVARALGVQTVIFPAEARIVSPVMNAGQRNFSGKGGEYRGMAAIRVDENSKPLRVVVGGGVDVAALGHRHRGLVHEGGQRHIHSGVLVGERRLLGQGLARGLAHIVVVAHEVAPVLLVAGRHKNLGPGVDGVVSDIPALAVPVVGRADLGRPLELGHGEGHVAHAALDIVRLQIQVFHVVLLAAGDHGQRAVPHGGNALPLHLALLCPGGVAGGLVLDRQFLPLGLAYVKDIDGDKVCRNGKARFHQGLSVRAVQCLAC